jgi:hypothetical protein
MNMTHEDMKQVGHEIAEKLYPWIRNAFLLGMLLGAIIEGITLLILRAIL